MNELQHTLSRLNIAPYGMSYTLYIASNLPLLSLSLELKLEEHHQFFNLPIECRQSGTA
jgi:hypothetical protein